DADWDDVETAGGFANPRIPSGYAPFGIAFLGGHIFVTYAKQKPGTDDDLGGPGLGFVAEFDTDGRLLRQVAAHGPLNSPWGLAMAPTGLGDFSGDLLVGNF